MSKSEGDPKLLRQPGTACEAVHRRPEATAWYKLAIALDPFDDEARQALFPLDHPAR